MNEKYEDEKNANNVCELYGAVWIVLECWKLIKNWTNRQKSKFKKIWQSIKIKIEINAKWK